MTWPIAREPHERGSLGRRTVFYRCPDPECPGYDEPREVEEEPGGESGPPHT